MNAGKGIYRALGMLSLGAAMALGGYARAQPCDINPPYNIWGPGEMDGTPVADGRETRVFVDSNSDGRYEPSEEVQNLSSVDHTINGYYDAFVSNCNSGLNAAINFDDYITRPRSTLLSGFGSVYNEGKKATMKLRFTGKTTMEWDPVSEDMNYDLVRGDRDDLAFSDGSVDLGPSLDCLLDNTLNIMHTDPLEPSSGKAFFYLAGPSSGHYGYSSENSGLRPRNVSSGDDCKP